MELKTHHLEKFKKLYKQELGIVLESNEAQTKLYALVLFAKLCQMPVNNTEK